MIVATACFKAKSSCSAARSKPTASRWRTLCCFRTMRNSNSKPELEIFADDVACGHGATAGQLDEDLLFYLRARGIPEREARALLIASFVGEVLDKIEDEALREALQEKVERWLAGSS